AERIFGYSQAQAVGREMPGLIIPSRLREQHQRGLAHFLSTGEGPVLGRRIELPALRADGVEFACELAIACIPTQPPLSTAYARDVTAARTGERALRESEERLRVTLSSIGDAVIATDARGGVTFRNPGGQAVAGWPQEEAEGRPLDEVFPIHNEETRLPVESPVVRVLREGVVVGLANHTLLVARDGTERPIADSGAPIRDGEEDIRGVVLVFRDVSEHRQAERA